MADNTTFQTTVATPPSGLVVAAREATFGGDTAVAQVVTLTAVTGSEGSYTVREVFYADDAAFTPATGGVLATGMLFDDTGPDSVDEGDIGIGRMSARREAYVQIRDAAGNERGLNVDASGNITVNVTGSVTVGSHAVTNAGTFAVQVDGDALTALQLIDDVVYVDDADWTDGASKHALVGGLYQSSPQTVTDGDVAPFNITANGALHVAVQNTLTVASHAVTNAGTFAVQAAQSGTWTVDLGATDNAVLDNIDADLTTIIGHVDGVEGLLTTIDGDTGNIVTAVQLIDDIVLAEDAAHQTGDKGVMALAVRQDVQADFGADGDYVPLSINADGELRVNVSGITVSGATEYTEAATDATFTGPIVMMEGAGDAAVPLQGTAADGLLVNLGSNNDVTVTGTVDLGATDNAVLDDIAAKLATIDADTSTLAAAVSTEYQVDIVGALPAGTNAIGKLAANSGVDIGDVDVTSISAGSNLIGDVGIQGRASGGTSTFRSIDLDESEEEVKATAGTIYSIAAFNRTAAPLYLKLYNLTAANTTVGTSTPTHTYVIPANADSDGAGFILNVPQGIAFSTAISAACTTGVADNDTGAPGANDCVVNIQYV